MQEFAFLYHCFAPAPRSGAVLCGEDSARGSLQVVLLSDALRAIASNVLTFSPPHTVN